MSQDIEQILLSLHSDKPADNLVQKILYKIQREKIHIHHRHQILLALSGSCVLLSILTIFLTRRLLQIERSTSPFLDYLKTLMMDPSVSLTYAKDFILSLLESLPILNILVTLAVAIFSCTFIWLLSKNRSKNSSFYSSLISPLF